MFENKTKEELLWLFARKDLKNIFDNIKKRVQ